MSVEDSVSSKTLVTHAGDFVIGLISITESIWHNQINKIFSSYALSERGAFSRTAFFQFKGNSLIAGSVLNGYSKLSGLGRR